ncbi:unnamed protein product [Parnassius mnemosyne]|uniref:FP protein C-terminal domain-containing protein n=1 Tax=Parnassius mnemosyne TaxID=213953 RepID=A0AAV1L490_9NEOP
MFLQRTPPNVFSSDGDIPASVKKISGESFITTRKRKQMENDKIDTNMIKFEEKFDNQMLIWNKTLAIASQIALLTYLLTYLSSRTIPDGQARQCNVEIVNIPDRRGENLNSIIECLGDAIKHPLQSSDIIAVHRVPHADKNDRRPKNVIVKFANRTLRDNVITTCRATKGLNSTSLSVPGRPATVYVNEHLTLNNKLLFRQCREAAKKNEYKYVWVKHGTVLARNTDTSPAIVIRSLQDIARIK